MDQLDGALMVIAKRPRPGLVKTRLCPPLTPQEACEVAWACLHDTLRNAQTVPAARHVVVLDGDAGEWVPAGFDVIAQRGVGLAERLAAAFADLGSTSAVLIAMDTPHFEPAELVRSLEALTVGAADAVLGLAADGGFWAIGLRRGVDADPVFAGIPMSTPSTGAAQLQRLVDLGLSTSLIGELEDIDTIDDLRRVAALVPDSRLGRLAQDLGLGEPTPERLSGRRSVGGSRHVSS